MPSFDWQEVILRFVSAPTSAKARTGIKHRRDGAVTIADDYPTHVVPTEAGLLDFIRAHLAVSSWDCLLIDADEFVNDSSAVPRCSLTVLLRLRAAHSLCVCEPEQCMGHTSFCDSFLSVLCAAHSHRS